MIVIEIDSTVTKEKRGSKDGKEWHMVFQQISISGHYIDGFPARHPRETTIQLEEGQQAYPAGRYTLASDSYFFGDFGRFTLGRLKLQPLKDYLAEIQQQLGVTVTYGKPAEIKQAA